LHGKSPLLFYCSPTQSQAITLSIFVAFARGYIKPNYVFADRKEMSKALHYWAGIIEINQPCGALMGDLSRLRRI
jgi:hypothetical protein